jgi:2-polyprenyl-6-methoxyphenol hydroxylase-like FAD-dependent oxidoreductase
VVTVKRGTELVNVCDGPAAVRASIRSPGDAEEVCFDVVAGCDGPASTVRAGDLIGTPARTASQGRRGALHTGLGGLAQRTTTTGQCA